MPVIWFIDFIYEKEHRLGIFVNLVIFTDNLPFYCRTETSLADALM